MTNREGDPLTPRSPKSSFRVRRTAPKGFISVAVLWIVGALSALVSVYAVYVINTASAFALYDNRLKAEALVSAALELTAYQQQTGSTLSRPTRGSFTFRMSQTNVEVEFRSEAARIDLNAAPKQLLVGLFLALGVRPEDADAYGTRIVGWRTPQSSNQNSEASVYRMARLGYQPREAKFPHANELSLVRDLPISVVERALPFVTVYSGRPQINMRDAASEVLASLPGMTQDRLSAILAQRETSPEKAKQLLPAEAQQYATLEGSQAFRVKIQITFDDSHTENAEVIVLLFETGDQPYAVLSWRDGSTGTISDNGL
jgi:general secretion pathway protein K